MEWDVFVSHASEDKATVARPLSEMLQRAGLKVWLDSNELTLGDSLSRKIDDGLAHSAYGVVILSQSFFRKRWPPHELAGLAAKQLIGDRKVILPVWHEVDQSFIVRYSPPLADVVAVSTKDGLEKVAADILRAIKVSVPGSPAPARRSSFATHIERQRWWTLAISITLLGIGAIIFRSLISRSGPPKGSADKELVEIEQDSRRPLFSRHHHAPISGYFVVSCNTCPRPRAWAFYFPVQDPEDKDSATNPALTRLSNMRTTLWPMVEFLYPEDTPGVGYCVDFPNGVCDAPGQDLPWSPRHNLAKPNQPAPSLRLRLKFPISGDELGVTNEGHLLAQGIHVRVFAWQLRAPGPELIKAYTVHDLGPLADDTIFKVFDDSKERNQK